MTVSCYIDNHYGLNDICMGLPAIVGKNGIENVLDIPLSEHEKQKLIDSSATLKEILTQIEL